MRLFIFLPGSRSRPNTARSRRGRNSRGRNSRAYAGSDDSAHGGSRNDAHTDSRYGIVEDIRTAYRLLGSLRNTVWIPPICSLLV